eukprot:Skav216725  [mRNA]  locus=scaffold653:82946:84268:+ [translate_table: standard]
MRETHPQCVPASCQKGAQLEQVLRDGTPCVLCNKPWKNSRLCPVTLQLAVLLIYHPRPVPAGPRALKCELCHRQFDTSAEMQDHLRSVHANPIFEWNPARDCLAGKVCRRCEARFTSIPGDNFDPHADCSILPLDPKITQVLNDGNALDHLQDPEDRLRWTVTCMCCGQAYKRSNDLSAHILQCHADLWRQAQPLVQMLRDVWYRVHGCLFCNPMLQYPRAQHVCLRLVQLAIHRVRCKAPLLVPYVFQEDDLCLLDKKLEPEMQDKIWAPLQQRTFSCLWTDPSLVAWLSRFCVVCGRATTSPGELLIHLIQRHQAERPGYSLFIPQLVECVKQEMPIDFQCCACDAIFNMPSHEDTDPSRQLLVQNHLQFQCPVLQHLAYLLTGHGHRGPADGTRSRGCSDEGRLQQVGPPVQRRAPPTAGSGAKATKGRKRHAEAPA